MCSSDLTGFAQLPQSSGLHQVLLYWRLGTLAQAKETSEAGISMGRTLHCGRSDPRRGVPPEEPEDWQERVESLECRTTPTFLRLEISHVSQKG